MQLIFTPNKPNLEDKDNNERASAMPTLSRKMDTVKPSTIVQINNKAKELKAQGRDILNFSIGVPNFAPPAHVIQAAHEGVDHHALGYLPGKGSQELLLAWQKRLKEDGFDYSTDEMCTAIGAKNALFSLFYGLLDEGDEVIFPAPYWSSYPDNISMVGGVSKIVPCPADQDYKMTASQLEAAITPKTKVFLFNNPSNPTGMVYSKEEVQALADVLIKHNIWIISDDIYDKMIYDGEAFHHLSHAQPGLKERTIIVQSVSKTYGMPGWRIGMVAGPQAIIKMMLTLNANTIMNVPGVSMAAGAAAFGGSHAFLDEVKPQFVARRDKVIDVLSDIEGVECPIPRGAFYAFPNVACVFGKTYQGQVIENDVTLCEMLLEHKGLALVPGSAFGDANAVRISYACPEDVLEEGLSRLKDFFNEIDM